MELITGITAFLKVLPDLLRLIVKIGLYFERIEVGKFVTDLEKVIDDTNVPNQTPEQARQNMQNLAGVLGRIRR